MTLRTTRQYAEVLVQGAGKVRVTRQVAEVLATGSGKARVSRQYVEYLISNTAPPSGIHNVAAADAPDVYGHGPSDADPLQDSGRLESCRQQPVQWHQAQPGH